MSGNVYGLQIGRQCDRTDIDEFVLKKDMLINEALSVTWEQIGGLELLPEDVPITAVSKILGHANPAITMGIYAHELQEDLDQVREAMAKFGSKLSGQVTIVGTGHRRAILRCQVITHERVMDRSHIRSILGRS